MKQTQIKAYVNKELKKKLQDKAKAEHEKESTIIRRAVLNYINASPQ